MSVGADCAFNSTHHSRTYRTNISAVIFGTINGFHRHFVYKHLFRIHLMLCQVFYVDVAEVTQTSVQSDICKVYTFDFQTFHQLTAEVQTSSRSSHRTFVLRKDRLKAFCIFRFHGTVDDRVGKWGLTQRVQSLFELVMRSVIKETERTSAGSGVINYFGHHRIVRTEIQFVTDTDLTCRIDQYVPQTKFFIQLTQQEYFDTSTCLFLVTIQTGREYLRIVEYKHIFIIKVVQHIFEHLVLNLTCITMQYHQTRLIPIFHRM